MSKLTKLLTTAALAGVMMASAAHAEEKRIAIVVKALGIGFFDAVDKGAEEAAKQLGDVKIIYTGPTADHRRGPDRSDQFADRAEGRCDCHLGQ